MRALGFQAAEPYLTWCRKSGFPARLSKTLAQRQEELKAAKRRSTQDVAQAAFLAHLTAMKLTTKSDYQGWCRKNGFGDGLHKSPSQRQSEIRHLGEIRLRERPAIDIQHRRRRRDAIEQVAAGSVPMHELTSPVLQRLAFLFASLTDQPDVHDAYLKLLLSIEKTVPFIHVKPAWSTFGQAPENTFVDGIYCLAHWYSFWIRDPSDWESKSHNQLRQFSELARHLLASYSVPECMDSAWFLGADDDALRQQDWFIHVGSGQNIRKADIPLSLSKRMAHEFLSAPRDLSMTEALRWSQFIGQGGEESMASAIIGTRLGKYFHDEPFWESVLYFFLNNPMLDSSCVGPIVDYIHHRRYVPVEAEDGDELEEQPAEPGFTMKGRTVESILRRVDSWHRDLVKEEKRIPESWQSGGFNGMEYVEEDVNAGEIRTWRLEELRSSIALYEEGKEMRNCVASYKSSCARNQKSIWSLKVTHEGAQTMRRVLTISVENRSNKITQVRGRNNSLPYKSDSDRYRMGWHVMGLWAKQEGLTLPSVHSRRMQPV
ncbi:MAG: hypothetical protein HOH43_11755 [Candidatus Latescibacteria bacterium]|nr:hypothetical protein [Candidatus Latescibacterota bacterium]